MGKYKTLLLIIVSTGSGLPNSRFTPTRCKSIVRDRGPVAKVVPKVGRLEPPPRPTRPRQCPNISVTPGRRKGGGGSESSRWAPGTPSGPCPTVARLGGTLGGPTVQGPQNTTPSHRPGPPGQWRRLVIRRGLRCSPAALTHAIRFSCPHPILRPGRPRHGGRFKLRPPAGSMCRVHRQTCALACIVMESHPHPSHWQERELQPQYVDPNEVFLHNKRNHVPGNACTSSNQHCDRQE